MWRSHLRHSDPLSSFFMLTPTFSFAFMLDVTDSSADGQKT